MTEKRKRGRPPGSGKRATAPEPENQFDKDFKEKGFGVTPNKGILAVDADKFTPLPENWFSMGKIDKLQWLTEHRK